MKSILIVVSLLGLCWSGRTQAQEPSGRIDLDVVSGSAFPTRVTFRVGFVENDRDCPETPPQSLQIWKAALTLVKVALPTDPRPSLPRQESARPSDDETQSYQIATPTCRMEIAVRQQVRRDGSWVSLLVPRIERPSVPSEERRELSRRQLEDLRARAQTPEAREQAERFMTAFKALHSAGSLIPIAGETHLLFAFEDRPQACFEAIGDYRIERTGVMFSFMTGLPGDLNRFTIERADPDPYRGRIFFTRGDCRFELTISQSAPQDSGELAVPLMPITATKG